MIADCNYKSTVTPGPTEAMVELSKQQWKNKSNKCAADGGLYLQGSLMLNSTSTLFAYIYCMYT